MSTCPTCGAPLEGQWKFCLRCGARLDALPAPPAAEVESAAPPAEPAAPVAESTDAAAPAAELAPTPTEAEPAPAEPAPAEPERVPAALRPDTEPPAEQRPLSTLAVVALALGIVGGPVAIIFGHLASRQVRQTGERGLGLARIATILGYLWLVVWAAVIVWVVASGAL